MNTTQLKEGSYYQVLSNGELKEGFLKIKYLEEVNPINGTINNGIVYYFFDHNENYVHKVTFASVDGGMLKWLSIEVPSIIKEITNS